MMKACGFAIGVVTLVSAALSSGCAASSQEPEEGVATTSQALSGAYYYSMGGTVAEDGAHYTNGGAVTQRIGNLGNGWSCMLTSINGNLTYYDAAGYGGTSQDSSGNWWLTATGFPGHAVSAAATCFPAYDQLYSPEYVSGETFEGDGWLIGFQGLGDSGGSFLAALRDNGSNNPLPFGSTWTFVSNNNGPGYVMIAGAVANQKKSWSWHANSGSIGAQTMAPDTVCWLTEISGNNILTTNDYSNGATAVVDNWNTGTWTFTAGPGVDAWWLCVD